MVVGLCDHNLNMRCRESVWGKNVLRRHVLEIFRWVNGLGVTDHSFGGGIQVVVQTESVQWLAVLTRILSPLQKFLLEV